MLKNTELSIKKLKTVCQESKEGWENRNWFDKHITRKISIYMTYISIKLGIKPNQVTFATLVVGLVGGVFIATGNKIYWVLGFLIVYLGVILDAVDGELARFYRKTTELGGYLDLFVGYFLHKYILLCMSMGLFIETGEILPFILGMISISSISLSAENNIYREKINIKLHGPSDCTRINRNLEIYNKIEEHILRSIFDYCYGFSLLWILVGLLDIVNIKTIFIQIFNFNIKLLFFIIYTIVVIAGCIKNCISSIIFLKNI